MRKQFREHRFIMVRGVLKAKAVATAQVQKSLRFLSPRAVKPAVMHLRGVTLHCCGDFSNCWIAGTANRMGLTSLRKLTQNLQVLKERKLTQHDEG